MEDSQTAVRSWQSPGRRARAQLSPAAPRQAASWLLCSTQTLSGLKSCIINPTLMWPGVVRALPVTEATARFQRPSLLRLLVFLKTMLFYTRVGHAASLCLPSALPSKHALPVVPVLLLRVICSSLRGRDVPTEYFPERITASMAEPRRLCRRSSLLGVILQMRFGYVCSASWDEKLQTGYKKIHLFEGKKLSRTHFSSRLPGKNPVSDFLEVVLGPGGKCQIWIVRN